MLYHPCYQATQPMVCFCSHPNAASMREAMRRDYIYVKPLDSCPFIHRQLFGFLVNDPAFYKLQCLSLREKTTSIGVPFTITPF